MTELIQMSPDSLVLQVVKSVSPDSSGKDILKRYRELVAKKSDEKRQSVDQSTLSHDSSNFNNLQNEFDLESYEKRGDTKPTSLEIFTDPLSELMQKTSPRSISSGHHGPGLLGQKISLKNVSQMSISESLAIFTDPECETQISTFGKRSAAPSSVLKDKSTNIIHRRRSDMQKHKENSTDKNAPNTSQQTKTGPLTNSDGLPRADVEKTDFNCGDNELFLSAADITDLDCFSRRSHGDDSVSIHGRSYPLNLSSPWDLLSKQPRSVTSTTAENNSFDQSTCCPLDVEQCPMTTAFVKGDISRQSTESMGMNAKSSLLLPTSTADWNDCCTHMNESFQSAVDVVTGLCSTSKGQHDNSDIAQSATFALLEKNKTLMKEVRFAEQTCVEVAERSAATEKELKRLQRENQSLKEQNHKLGTQLFQVQVDHAKLEEAYKGVHIEKQKDLKFMQERMEDMSNAEHFLKDENTRLNQQNTDLKLENTTLEERYRVLTSKFTEQELLHQREIKSIQDKLDEVKCLSESFMEGLEESNRSKGVLEIELAAVRAKYDTLVSEHSDAKVAIDRLMNRSTDCTLSTNKNSDVEVLRNALVDLQNKYDQKCREVNFIKEEKENIELQCRERVHLSSPSTPTSKILAETLRNELERNHMNVSRLISLERTMAMSTRSVYESEDDGALKMQDQILTKRATTALDHSTSIQYNVEERHNGLMMPDHYSFEESIHVPLLSCQYCDSLREKLESAHRRIYQLENELDTYRNLKLQADDTIKSNLESAYQLITEISESIENRYRQKIDSYSLRLDALTESLAVFQSLCTFVDEEEHNEVSSTSSIDKEDCDDIRARIATLRSDVLSIVESLGEDVDNMDLPSDQNVATSLDKLDSSLSVTSNVAQRKETAKSSEETDPIDRDGRITVVVNLYTK